MRRIALCALVMLTIAGCTDSRVKRATSLLNEKTKKSKFDFNNATQPEVKIQTATEYFDTASRFTQAIDDYTHGRTPTDDPTLPAKPATP